MRAKTFNEIKDEVLSSKLTKAEIQRIDEELVLFEDRGWNDFIAFSINLIQELDDKFHFCFPHLSVMDSLFVRKALYPNDDYAWFLRKQRPRDILFVDALRLGIEIIEGDPKSLAYLSELNAFIVTNYARFCNMKYRGRVLERKPAHGRMVLAMHPNYVPSADFNVIANERKDGPREEIDILRRYLIVDITYRVGM